MESQKTLEQVAREHIDALLAESGWVVQSRDEINFTRYHFKPHTLRTAEQIRAGIPAPENKAEVLLDDILEMTGGPP